MKPNCDRRECKEPWPNLVAQDWPGVRQCQSCATPVFLSSNWEDADALGRVGHCVALAPSFHHPPIFIGLSRADILDSRPSRTVLALALPTDAKHRERAIAGFQLYFSKLPDFADLKERFLAGQPVSLPPMPWCEAGAWRPRLGEWHIEVKNTPAV